MANQSALAAAPVLDIDPFSNEFLMDPYRYHRQLREAGPIVWIPKYEIWAMARYDEVYQSLKDWESFSSAAGGGLSNFNNEKPWRKPSIVLEADPPLHTRTRGVLNRILNRVALEKLRANFEAEAERVIDDVIAKGRIDGVKDLAEVFPLHVFPQAVGLQREGRERLLPYANMAFNAFGPRNALYEEAFQDAAPVIEWISKQCQRDALSKDGFGAQIYAASDAGELNEEEASMLVRSLLTAGLDTTIYGITNALFSFASFPEQWQLLRDNPNLLQRSFEEVIRFQSPVQTFFRTTTKQINVGGIDIDSNQKVLLILASANRDPKKWKDPEQFDIRRNASGHVGFGAGIHVCVGQMVARLEAEVILAALLRKVKSITLEGEPVRRLNNTLRGLQSLPLRLHPL